MQTVAIITPTVGSVHLRACVASVCGQTSSRPTRVIHVLVADGPEAAGKVRDVVESVPSGQTERMFMALSWNTGSGGWNGHKIYAAVPHLLPQDVSYVMFLDEDNTLDADHVSTLTASLAGAPPGSWAFALRKIMSPRGETICLDVCESLGSLHHTVLHENDYLVDVNCYCLPLSLAQRTSWCWQRRARDPTGEVDRILCRELLPLPHRCSGVFSVNYRVGDARQDSVQAEFFVRGNQTLWSSRPPANETSDDGPAGPR